MPRYLRLSTHASRAEDYMWLTYVAPSSLQDRDSLNDFHLAGQTRLLGFGIGLHISMRVADGYERRKRAAVFCAVL